jgi:hypothetical protein
MATTVHRRSAHPYEQATAGDEDAFNQLMNEYEVLAPATCYRVLHQRELAEAAIQESTFNFWRSSHRAPADAFRLAYAHGNQHLYFTRMARGAAAQDASGGDCGTYGEGPRGPRTKLSFDSSDPSCGGDRRPAGRAARSYLAMAKRRHGLPRDRNLSGMTLSTSSPAFSGHAKVSEKALSRDTKGADAMGITEDTNCTRPA